MRIGIDIDGVLTDIEQWQLDCGGKFFSKLNKSVVNKDGYEITDRYLTDRNTEQGQQMREIVVKWLDEQKIYYDKIIFSPEDKLEDCKKNNIDVMIEDKVENINNVSTAIPVICFHAGYNKECKGQNIYRAYNWYDIYNLINGGKICKKK